MNHQPSPSTPGQPAAPSPGPRHRAAPRRRAAVRTLAAAAVAGAAVALAAALAQPANATEASLLPNRLAVGSVIDGACKVFSGEAGARFVVCVPTVGYTGVELDTRDIFEDGGVLYDDGSHWDPELGGWRY